jgi:5-methylcytosine-specific restriction endonuclease McrA
MKHKRPVGNNLVNVEYLYRRDRGKCQICHRPVKIEEAVLDHIIPNVSEPGRRLYGEGHGVHSDPANAQIAHRACNVRRGNHGPAQIRLFG